MINNECVNLIISDIRNDHNNKSNENEIERKRRAIRQTLSSSIVDINNNNYYTINENQLEENNNGNDTAEMKEKLSINLEINNDQNSNKDVYTFTDSVPTDEFTAFEHNFLYSLYPSSSFNFSSQSESMNSSLVFPLDSSDSSLLPLITIFLKAENQTDPMLKLKKDSFKEVPLFELNPTLVSSFTVSATPSLAYSNDLQLMSTYRTTNEKLPSYSFGSISSSPTATFTFPSAFFLSISTPPPILASSTNGIREIFDYFDLRNNYTDVVEDTFLHYFNSSLSNSLFLLPKSSVAFDSILLDAINQKSYENLIVSPTNQNFGINDTIKQQTTTAYNNTNNSRKKIESVFKNEIDTPGVFYNLNPFIFYFNNQSLFLFSLPSKKFTSTSLNKINNSAFNSDESNLKFFHFYKNETQLPFLTSKPLFSFYIKKDQDNLNTTINSIPYMNDSNNNDDYNGNPLILMKVEEDESFKESPDKKINEKNNSEYDKTFLKIYEVASFGLSLDKPRDTNDKFMYDRANMERHSLIYDSMPSRWSTKLPLYDLTEFIKGDKSFFRTEKVLLKNELDQGDKKLHSNDRSRKKCVNNQNTKDLADCLNEEAEIGDITKTLIENKKVNFFKDKNINGDLNTFKDNFISMEKKKSEVKYNTKTNESSYNINNEKEFTIKRENKSKIIPKQYMLGLDDGTDNLYYINYESDSYKHTDNKHATESLKESLNSTCYLYKHMDYNNHYNEQSNNLTKPKTSKTKMRKEHYLINLEDDQSSYEDKNEKLIDNSENCITKQSFKKLISFQNNNGIIDGKKKIEEINRKAEKNENPQKKNILDIDDENDCNQTNKDNKSNKKLNPNTKLSNDSSKQQNKEKSQTKYHYENIDKDDDYDGNLGIEENHVNNQNSALTKQQNKKKSQTKYHYENIDKDDDYDDYDDNLDIEENHVNNQNSALTKQQNKKKSQTKYHYENIDKDDDYDDNLDIEENHVNNQNSASTKQQNKKKSQTKYHYENIDKDDDYDDYLNIVLNHIRDRCGHSGRDEKKNKSLFCGGTDDYRKDEISKGFDMLNELKILLNVSSFKSLGDKDIEMIGNHSETGHQKELLKSKLSFEDVNNNDFDNEKSNANKLKKPEKVSKNPGYEIKEKKDDEHFEKIEKDKSEKQNNSLETMLELTASTEELKRAIDRIQLLIEYEKLRQEYSHLKENTKLDINFKSALENNTKNGLKQDGDHNNVDLAENKNYSDENSRSKQITRTKSDVDTFYKSMNNTSTKARFTSGKSKYNILSGNEKDEDNQENKNKKTYNEKYILHNSKTNINKNYDDDVENVSKTKIDDLSIDIDDSNSLYIEEKLNKKEEIKNIINEEKFDEKEISWNDEFDEDNDDLNSANTTKFIPEDQDYKNVSDSNSSKQNKLIDDDLDENEDDFEQPNITNVENDDDVVLSKIKESEDHDFEKNENDNDVDGSSNTNYKIDEKINNKPSANVKISEKFALDAIFDEPDLTLIAKGVNKSKVYQSNSILIRISMTILAPVDSAFSNLPIDIDAIEDDTFEIPNKDYVLETILMYHVIAPRLIRPEQIEYNKTIEIETRNGQSVKITRSALNNDVKFITVNGIKVVGLVQTKRGYIYKLEKYLSPRWNSGPNILEWLRITPGYTKTLYLVEQIPEILDLLENVGPVTLLIVPDTGWIFLNGQAIPDCVFKALVKPEKRYYIYELIKWMTLPGLWYRIIIEKKDWIPIINDSLMLSVAHVENQIQNTLPADINIFDNDISPNYAYTFIEGRQVLQWDIPVFNGLIHVLAESSLRSDIPITDIALWECVNSFCHECPMTTKLVLNYFDFHGELPGINPFELEAPPSIRPDWVCKSSKMWYPPGWYAEDWYSYLKEGKKDHNKKAIKKAQEGWLNASVNQQIILDRYNEIRWRAEVAKRAYNENQPVKKITAPEHWIIKLAYKNVRELPCKGDEKEFNYARKFTEKDYKYIAKWK